MSLIWHFLWEFGLQLRFKDPFGKSRYSGENPGKQMDDIKELSIKCHKQQHLKCSYKFRQTLIG